jgi:hypothetical protein
MGNIQFTPNHECKNEKPFMGQIKLTQESLQKLEALQKIIAQHQSSLFPQVYGQYLLNKRDNSSPHFGRLQTEDIDSQIILIPISSSG